MTWTGIITATIPSRTLVYEVTEDWEEPNALCAIESAREAFWEDVIDMTSPHILDDTVWKVNGEVAA